jgi:hypothetical protein
MGKYDHINFKPPAGVRKAAKRGLELRKKFHRGGISTQKAGQLGIGSGIERAVTLSKGLHVSPSTAKRMNNYFNRHQKDRRPGWSSPKKPTNGYIAWLLWGGDPGRAWARKLAKQIKNADSKP